MVIAPGINFPNGHEMVFAPRIIFPKMVREMDFARAINFTDGHHTWSSARWAAVRLWDEQILRFIDFCIYGNTNGDGRRAPNYFLRWSRDGFRAWN